jgi:hypothetical protein
MLWEFGEGSVRERAFGACVLFAFLLPGIAPARAQTAPPPAPPLQGTLTGFVSSYEIMRAIRAAGFAPLAPPLREGADYVLRATDFRGILMRVVIDARTAAIRDVTRIVPGPGRYGQFYAEPAYGAADLEDPMGAPMGRAPIDGAPIGAGFEVRPSAARSAPNPTVTLRPPLPRPRPAALASRKPDDAAAAAKSSSVPAARTETNGAAATVAEPSSALDAKSRINSEVITAAPPPGATQQRAPAAVEPLND